MKKETLDCVWSPPPADWAQSSEKVHVWRVSLDQPVSRVESLEPVLAADELDRAGRFHFEKDRRRFVVARGLLRVILGRYLDIEPGQVSFSYSDHGKPYLVPPSAQETLDFNLSHSHGLALYAMARGRDLGVDLERIRTDLDYEGIAERFFSSQENAALRALPAKSKPQAFFNCWTRKEAYIKARGEGLSLPLDQFDVSLTPGEAARLLDVRGDPQELSRWSLRDLAPAPGYVAALAVKGHNWRLACWQWPGDLPIPPELDSEFKD